MPLELTTPYDPADADPGKLYTHVKISEMIHYTESKAIRLTLSRGYLVDGKFETGRYFPPIPPIVIRDHVEAETDPDTGDVVSVSHPDYTSAVATQVGSSDEGAYVYDLVANKLYQYLIDNVDGFDGVIV